MLSRHAESIYWLGRYVERAENTARLVNVHAHLLLDLPGRYRQGWGALIAITGSSAEFGDAYREPSERNVLRFLIADPKYPGSILSSLHYARENARTLRDRLPRETWEQLNELYLRARQESATALSKSRRYEYLESIIRGAQLFAGTLSGTMSHDHAYDFLRLGRMLERADMTSRIVDVRSAALPDRTGEDPAPFESIQWLSVLHSLSAHQMYRQTMRGPVTRVDVLRFLLLDPRFPRSVEHCLGVLRGRLAALPRGAPLARRVAALAETLHRTRFESLEREGLHRFVDELQVGLGALHAAIASTCFGSEPGAPAATAPQRDAHRPPR
jgi:uncharacterized alpha-E superfamily protein